MNEFLDSFLNLNGFWLAPLSLLLASYTSIFSIANPLAAMPVFLSLTEDNTNDERQELSKWASTYMFMILIIFLIAGTYILNFFGISLPGIRIAGGLMIMRSAYSMLSPEQHGEKLTDEDKAAARQKEDITFSPLAMPLLSGPGSIAVVIGLASQATSLMDYAVISLSIFLVAVTAYLVLRVAPAAVKYIGQTGMTVMTRMMGFIALAIGVQFIINGIAAFFEIG